MSATAIITNVFAAIREEALGLSKSDDQPGKGPKRPFAETPALIIAGEESKADNLAIVGMLEGSIPPGDTPNPVGSPSCQATGAGVPDQKTQGSDASTELGGWDTQACSKPIRPEVDGTGRTMQAVSREIAEEGRKSPVMERETEPKRIGLKTNAGPNMQRTAESPKGDMPGVEPRRNANSEGTDTVHGRPLAQALHNVQQAAREVHPQGRSRSAALADSVHARQTGSGVAAATGGIGKVEAQGPADGERANYQQATLAAANQPGPGVCGADRSAAVSPLASHHASAAGGLEGPAAKQLTQGLGEQICDSLRASLAHGERHVVIRLHPPELGSVLVRLGEQNEQIHGVLEVSRGDIRHEVEQALPDVLRSLQELGLQVRRLEVTVSDQSQKDPGRQPLEQDAWPQQQGSNRYTHPSDSEIRNSNFEFDGADVTATVGVPDGRIDMLV